MMKSVVLCENAIRLGVGKLGQNRAENLWLRQQLQVALRRAPARLHLRGTDRAIMVWMARIWPELIGSTQVVKPETVLRWQRAFWRWKSRRRAGRPRRSKSNVILGQF
jgi:hypothetical protein